MRATKRRLSRKAALSETPNMDAYRQLRSMIRTKAFQWQAMYLDQAESVVNSKTAVEEQYSEQWAWDVLTLFGKAIGNGVKT